MYAYFLPRPQVLQGVRLQSPTCFLRSSQNSFSILKRLPYNLETSCKNEKPNSKVGFRTISESTEPKFKTHQNKTLSGSQVQTKNLSFTDNTPGSGAANYGSFSFPNARPIISSNVISTFLTNLGQTPVQDSENIFLVKCPNCNNDSNISANKTFVKPGSGTYYCSACTAKGPWERFMDLTLQNGKEEVVIPTNESDSGYICSASVTSSNFKPLQQYPELLNSLLVPTGHFSEQTIKDYRVSAYSFTPVANPNDPYPSKTQVCIGYPRTNLDPSSKSGSPSYRTVSARAVNFPEGKTVWFDPPNPSEPGFFGYHLIAPTCDSIVLTPREVDAMAVYEGTGMPCLSLPRLENQLPIEHMPLLKRFKRIYLWFDGDVSGQGVAQLLARKIGLDRAYIVKNVTPGGTAFHNAFSAFKMKLDLKEVIASAKLYTHSKVMTFENLHDSVMLEIMHADQVQGTPSNDFPQFSELIKGLRPGELTVFTGPTGTGKTTFLSQLSLDFAKSGVSTLWGSFEISNTRLVKRMIFQLAGKSLEGDLDEFRYWSTHFKQLPMYFMRFFGTTRVRDVIEAMEHAVHAYDVQHVLIDNLQFMSSGLGRGYEKFEIQDEALSLFRRFATQQNVHVTLVVHPRKDERAQLEMASIFGTAKMTQEADNVIILQAGPKQYRCIDLKKNRFDGTTGSVPVLFDKATFKSYELTPEERKKFDDLADKSSHNPSGHPHVILNAMG